VISLFVMPGHRRRGVGHALLEHMEAALRGKRYRSIQVNYQDDWVNTAALDELMKTCGWSSPRPVMLQCKGSMQGIAAAEWLDRHALPDDFQIFPWSDLTAVERSDILNRQRCAAWYPPELTPFQEENRIEYLNSLGLRHNGEVVGWMITHRLDANTIQYTSLFVRKEFQRLGRAIPLLAEAIRRQMPSGIERGVCQIHLDSLPMIRYMKRRIWPHDTKIVQLIQSGKTLAGDISSLTDNRAARRTCVWEARDDKAKAVG
jgi:GNAT superfamily N-acetyltransferase